MSFFSNILGTNIPQSTALTKEESFTGILLAMVAADGDISDEEAADFRSVVNKAKMIRNVSNADFSRIVDKLFKILKRDGANQLIDLSVENLPSDIHLSTFAIAADLVFSDGTVENEEEQLLDRLKNKLYISDENAQKIVEVIVIKNNA